MTIRSILEHFIPSPPALTWLRHSLGGGLLCLAVGLALPDWPLVGVTLALVLSWGITAGPGALLGNALVLGLQGMAPGLAVAVALGDTSVAWLGAYWLLHHGFDGRLENRRDIWLLAGAGVGFVAVLSAAIGAACLVMAGQLPLMEWTPAWLLRWLHATLGLVVVGVPVLTLRRAALESALANRRWIETMPLTAATLAAGVAALAWQMEVPKGNSILLFVPHALLCWLTMRAGIAFGSATVMGLVGIGTLATTSLLGSQAQGVLAAPGGYVASMAALVLLVHALAIELRRSEQRWQSALASHGIGVAEWNLDGEPGYTSAAWRHMLDDAEGLHTAVLQNWLTRLHPDDRDSLQPALGALVRDPTLPSLVQPVRLHSANGWNWFELRLSCAERNQAGRARRLIAALTDIQARRSADEQQRLSNSLFENVHEGLLIADAELRVIDANPKYCALVGVDRALLIGSVPTLLQGHSPDALTRQQQAAMWAGLQAGGRWSGEVRVPRRGGEDCTLQVTVVCLSDPEGHVRHHVVMASDITELRSQRERLERQAHFDELTQLPNRKRLTELLVHAMAASEQEGNLLTLCYLDLDHFKAVNERYGRAAGDRLLVELSKRLRATLRAHASWADVAARFGGDEFVLLLRAHSMDEARLAVERVRRVVAMPFDLGHGLAPVAVSASLGATVYPLDRSDADTLMRHADQAMFGAKQAGRNTSQIFDLEENRLSEARVIAVGRVQDALDRQQLELHYQPIVDMRRGKVLGFEALLRWNQPGHGLVGPAQFLPLIEDTGLAVRVGDWVLAHALDQLDRWQEAGLDFSVSVNVSAKHLQEPDFAQRLSELLARHRRPLGQRLELEVLETAALADVGLTSSLLERCATLGVRFALDDFGTGYSTLTYLKRLPVHVLKIDRSFVHNMLGDAQDRAIVEGVISLARTFGCVAVAEGVQTPAQARVLLELGCEIGQGIGIAAPMPASQVAPFVRDWRGPFPLAAAG